MKVVYKAIHAKKIVNELIIENLQKKIKDLLRKVEIQSIIIFDLKNVNKVINNFNKRRKKHFLTNQNFLRFNFFQQNLLNKYERFRNDLIFDMFKIFFYRFFSKFNS